MFEKETEKGMEKGIVNEVMKINDRFFTDTGTKDYEGLHYIVDNLWRDEGDSSGLIPWKQLGIDLSTVTGFRLAKKMDALNEYGVRLKENQPEGGPVSIQEIRWHDEEEPEAAFMVPLF